jgi:hypothetical protein
MAVPVGGVPFAGVLPFFREAKVYPDRGSRRGTEWGWWENGDGGRMEMVSGRRSVEMAKMVERDDLAGLRVLLLLHGKRD